MELEHLLKSFEENFGRGRPEPIESEYATRKEFLAAKLQWKMAGGLQAPAGRMLLDKIPPKTNSAQLRELYSWANGELGSGYFKPTYSFLSIEQALEQSDAYAKMVEVQRTLPRVFLKFWPLFVTENRTDIGVFLSETVRKTPQLYSLSVWDGQLSLLSTSIELYLKALFVCRMSGVYSSGRISEEDPDSYLSEEAREFNKIHDQPIFPLVRAEGVTMFHLDERSFWPNHID